MGKLTQKAEDANAIPRLTLGFFVRQIGAEELPECLSRVSTGASVSEG